MTAADQLRLAGEVFRNQIERYKFTRNPIDYPTNLIVEMKQLERQARVERMLDRIVALKPN